MRRKYYGIAILFTVIPLGFSQVKKVSVDNIVQNDVCEIPDLPVFPWTFNVFQTREPISCSLNKLLTYTTVEGNKAKLHIDKDVIPQYGNVDDIDCCYKCVSRAGSENYPDVGISYSQCQRFNNTVEVECDTVKVICYFGYFIKYSNVHRVITVPEEIKKKTDSLKSKSTKKPISVLFIVIDSISRLNFIRTMPRTRTYIMENDFVEFKAYNKVSDNTFPNFMAWLTGMNYREQLMSCSPVDVGGLDNCSMIWYEYRDLGYATAYAEDETAITTFNYLKKGFKNPPTDYYFKPYVEASENLGVLIQDTMPFCTGPQSAGERILNLAEDFSKTFKGKPSFGVFWMNTFSHNNITTPMTMDKKFETFFRTLKTNGILDESIVVFLSDHGIRFGDIICTHQGFFEERLPMNYISIPRWFKDEFTRETKNFMDNSNKLTSTYDMYMTLQHILVLSGINYTVKPSQACPTCRSLFQELPSERSCLHAGLTEEWCTCMGAFNPISLNKEVTDSFSKDIKNAIDFKLEEFSVNLNATEVFYIGVSDSTKNQLWNKEEYNYFLITYRTSIGSVYQALYKNITRNGSENKHKIVQIRKCY